MQTLGGGPKSDLPCARTVLVVFGTRPEVIKLAPVIRALAEVSAIRLVTVSTGQHADLLPPLLTLFDLHVDHDLQLMTAGQTPTQFCARLLPALEQVLATERPNFVVVQGDTTTALGASLAAFYQQVPLGHVEAGLRTGDAYNPFPEEMNRRLISRLATLHFAPTVRNRDLLIDERIPKEQIVITGNPVVDAVRTVLQQHTLSAGLQELLAATAAFRRLVLTTHRRESFGSVLAGNLRVIREFVADHEDLVLLFPVHPNPCVRQAVADILAGQPRVHLLPPLPYGDFIGLLARAWLVVSDSGGVQEEVPSLGVPLVVLRTATERPEAIACGCARLAGDRPEQLQLLLEEEYQRRADRSCAVGGNNPFGNGDSGRRIVDAIREYLQIPATAAGPRTFSGAPRLDEGLA
jgi:UDP-N-acetylglucosamine 2-epimerase (non-hydrolysing)